MDAPMLIRLLRCVRLPSRAAGFSSSSCDVVKNSVISRNMVTANKVQASSIKRKFRTEENDPTKHTLDDVGLFYRMQPDELTGFLRHCVHPFYLRQIKTFNEACLMVRKPALELNGYLQNINLKHPVPRFLLYGPRGAGKDMIMLHTLQYCSRKDWIIVHVPWAGIYVRGFYKEPAESSFKPGRYDLPNDAANWLNLFRRQNQGKLTQLKTTAEYLWTKREKSEAGTSFDEIIDFGLNRLKFSSDCVGVILKELRQQAQTAGLKVLVSIDAVNAFFMPWRQVNALKNSERKVVEPSNISLVHNFKKMMSPTWSHGAVVGTVREHTNDTDYRGDYTPKYLLGQEPFKENFTPVDDSPNKLHLPRQKCHLHDNFEECRASSLVDLVCQRANELKYIIDAHIISVTAIEVFSHKYRQSQMKNTVVQGFEWLDPFVPILVPEYTEEEALNCIEYYIDRNWIQHERGKTEEGKKEIMFVSNKNPFSLYQVCSSL